MSKPRQIAVFGSTGSIGTQTLDLVRKHPDLFRTEILTARNNLELLIKQAKEFLPETVIIANKDHYNALKDSLKNLKINVLAGEEEIEAAAGSCRSDLIVAAMVGYAGMKPVISAVGAGKNIALANKETLVVAGELIKNLSEKTGSRILPVDSEHSALFQCLEGEKISSVEKIVLTASGGPFLAFNREQLLNVTPAQALKHPNWEMGSKVTIDSATLMNKGLEVIEAKWLFDLEPEKIDVVVHPQSIIHSLVYFHDGSVKAQLGMPDMRIPILYALAYPDRVMSELPRLDLAAAGGLTFRKPDTSLFRSLSLAYHSLRAGGNMPCIMNAANEVAVTGFLEGKTGFLNIPEVVEFAMEKTRFEKSVSLEALEEADRESRSIALKYLNSKSNNKK